MTESLFRTDPQCSAIVRRRPNYAPDQKRKEAFELFKSGLGYTRIARQLNLPTNTVRDWSRSYKAGTFRTTLPMNQYRYGAETKSWVVRMRGEGASWNAIREATGVPSATARKWVESAELKKTSRSLARRHKESQTSNV